ncbi:MAG TPA: glycosyltransferase family 87 protein [Gemmatimonadaceae bacterium]
MAGKLAGAHRARKAGVAPDARERACTFALYLATALLAALQRALSRHAHWTYPVFRESFRHLMSGQSLYAHYPAQGYDLFKYSPTFALLFAPFALVPFAAGLVAWDAINALAIWSALDRLLPPRDATIAALLIYPEVLVAAQASQSNALVSALIILAFVALERDRSLGAAVAVGLGTAIKIFPIAAISLAIPRRRRARLAIAALGAGLALLALPLLVAPPHVLLGEYRQWLGVERVDALDRGASVMGLIARVVPGRWPDWPVQLAGTGVLLLPVVLRRDRWGDPAFRLEYLCSLLVYVVIFNHQAERPSYVIAATGIAIWWVRSARELWRTVLLALSLVGLGAAPCLAAWLVMQGELAAGSSRGAP